MEPINIVKSVYAPLDRKNVDTDQIISKEFLKRIERTGFGEFLFYHWRFDKEGNEIEGFVLNKPEYKEAEILVAQDNFGCGSSREHAPWAILDYGFHVVIAPSFADIFHNNCFKNGILPIKLTEAECDELLAQGLQQAQEIEVNLEAQTVTAASKVYSFNIDPYYKEMLLNGWDEIALTFKYEDEIAAYEAKRVVFE
ncbi:3-isopropylmalate dehydratase small subunit [Metasolibacillus sp.]|uniref:3-isopropylmalate dehydratase small subunit n=1 Tax=Metasolibacillus sp. TaxID=2703680 RepID=UPI0025F5F9A8|nr:3-isopropylmalate dehydratase small subunit [Metasolibacillus sp.]MCT6922905.1 3-isopropylmalate dehydratase small subunit [Metasolibacillus sp.]MCT6939143.1 3-isopropylmalate dehydratase small subunit [Metasolibacillus sp.]